MTLLHTSSAESNHTGVNGFEPLDPVVLSPDVSEILSLYPELETLYRLPVNLFDADILTDENLKLNGISREERRSQAVDPRLHRAAKTACLSIGHLLAAEGPDTSREAYQSLISEWETSRNVKAENYPYLRITLNYINPAEVGDYITGVNAYSGPLQRRMVETVQDSSANQYQLFKLLTSSQSQECVADLDAESQSPDFQSLRWLTLMALMRPDRSHAPIAELLAKNLNSGMYDRYIAYDLLSYVHAYPTEGNMPEPIAAIKSLISLIEHSASTPADGQIISRLADGFSLGIWPKEHQNIVFKQRKILLDNLKFLFDTVSNFTAGVVAVDGRDYQKFLYKELDVLADIEQRDMVAAVKAVGQTAANHLSQKRRHNPQLNGNGIVPQQPELDLSPEREPLSLMYVDGSGALFDAGSEQFSDLISGYLQKRKNTPHLEEDLQKILAYLSSLDFSNGGVRGLKRIDEAYLPVMINGQLKEYPLWEFKPGQAQGLSLRSDTATRTRVFFCMPNGAKALAIRDLERRTDSRNKLIKRPRGRKRSRRKS